MIIIETPTTLIFPNAGKRFFQTPPLGVDEGILHHQNSHVSLSLFPYTLY